MDPTVSTADILLRLTTAVAAGAIIGFDRGARGRTAGVRTMILVSIAAAGAMIEANLLLSVTGKTTESFSQMDTLRLPLGVLSGIGFIGAGAILKRGDLVTGVTTAATIWVTTVIGLILGAGYFLLGGAVTGITFVVLALIVKLESLMDRQHQAHLTVDVREDGPTTDRLRTIISDTGYKVTALAIREAENRRIRCRLTWHSREMASDVPPLVGRRRREQGVLSLDWQPIDAGEHAD